MRMSNRFTSSQRETDLDYSSRRRLLDSEQPAIARFDLLAHLLHCGGIVLHLLDLAERLAARLLLDLRMQRAQSANIDDELLRLGREAEALKQPRGIGIWCVLE